MKKIFITISAVILAACTVFESDHDNYWLNNIRPFKTRKINYYNQEELQTPKLTNSETINTHTYKRNVIVSANLGQRMVDAKTYDVKTYEVPQFVPLQDGEIYTSDSKIEISKNDAYTPLGEVKINGSYFLVIDPKNDGQLILINEHGEILNMICHLYKGDLLMSREKAMLRPANLSVKKENKVSQTTDAASVKFEIKYDGLEDNLMSFIYTDYSNANSSSGYFQRFMFPKGQELININGIKFKVMDVYPDRIEYMLIE